MKSLLISLILGLTSFAGATTPEYIEMKETPLSRVEITAAGGVALQTGYLTSQDSVGSYVLGVNFLMPGGIFTFEWQGFDADHDTAEFALNNGKSVSVSTMAFIPYVQVLSKDVWKAFLGIGFVNVGLYQTSPDYNSNFASFIFSGQVRYELNPKWSFFYKTQWFDVSQTVSDQTTGFEVWNHLLGVGYGIN